MNHNENIDKRIDEALNSLDGTERATAKPYLFTRLHARMQRTNDSAWDKSLRFISRPVVAMAILCVVIIVNGLAISRNYNSKPAPVVPEEQYASVYEYNNSVAVLDDIENTEP